MAGKEVATGELMKGQKPETRQVPREAPGYKVKCSHAREDCAGCRHHGPHLPVAEDEGKCHEVADECVFHGLKSVKCVPAL